jgi:protein-disulfide isomerase
MLPLTIAAVALVALIVTLVGGLGSDDPEGPASEASSSEAGEQSRAPDATWEQLVRREADDPMAIGDADAPVVMVSYSEFQCPFCGKFARDTEPTLIDQYVEDGTLRIEWRDFPYLGSESTTAAQGGRAAAAQDSFWAFQDEMYANQLPPNSGNLDEDYLAGIAEKLGLDVEQFRADMNSQVTEQAIAEDFSEGQAIGVTGTPAFVINGVPVIGAQPTEVFEQIIEQAAAEAG